MLDLFAGKLSSSSTIYSEQSFMIIILLQDKMFMLPVGQVESYN